jgi:hypothetical protein
VGITNLGVSPVWFLVSGVADKKKPSDDERIHGRSREVKHVVKQMSDVDFFDYRLVVRSSGIQELIEGHTSLRQGLLCVESLCEELRGGNYQLAHSHLLRSLQIFEQSHNQIRRALTDLGEYYDDHPIEVREINHGLTDMCDGCDCLVKSLVALRQVKTGESLELGKRALTHLRESAHRIGSHLRDIKDCCPSNVEFEVLDIRDQEARIGGGIEGARPVEMVSCHSTHGPGEPCDQAGPEPVKNDKQENKETKESEGQKTAEEPKAAEPAKEAKDAKDAIEVRELQQIQEMKAQQLEDHHVPLDQIAQAVEAMADPSAVTSVPLISRGFDDESAMEELMRQVSLTRAQTIDRLVADARAAKAEAIGSSDHVPLPGEQVPGMQPMGVKTGPMQAAANVVDVGAKLGAQKKVAEKISEKPADNVSEKAPEKTAEKPTKAEKPEKSGKKKGGKVLEIALEKAKETAKKRPRKFTKSETKIPAAAKPEKKKPEEDLSELTFDDADLDFNKAAKKKT